MFHNCSNISRFAMSYTVSDLIYRRSSTCLCWTLEVVAGYTGHGERVFGEMHASSAVKQEPRHHRRSISEMVVDSTRRSERTFCVERWMQWDAPGGGNRAKTGSDARTLDGRHPSISPSSPSWRQMQNELPAQLTATVQRKAQTQQMVNTERPLDSCCFANSGSFQCERLLRPAHSTGRAPAARMASADL
jgi:hypothetical protein